MSDLHRAVEAEIRAFTPDRIPPLAALKDRRRSRDRRRHAVAGAALSVAALAGAAAIGPGLLNGAPDTARSVAGGSASTDAGGPVALEVGPTSLERYEDPLFGAGLDACLRLPGTSNIVEFASLPASFQVTVTGSDAIDAFTSCVDEVVGYAAVVAPSAGGRAWSGATICLGDACRTVGAEKGRRTDDVLGTAVPAPPNTVYCQALGRTYTVRFEHPAETTAPILVRTPCGPMERGEDKYLLDKAAQDQVEAIYQAEDSPPVDGPQPSARVDGLAVGETVEITLATPCGVPPLLVDGIVHLPTGYAAPGTNPPGWGTTQTGRLGRITNASLTFIADGSTVRLQFLAAPGRTVQGCD